MISVPTRPMVTTPASSRSASSFLLTAVVLVSSRLTFMVAAIPGRCGAASRRPIRAPGARLIRVGLAVRSPMVEDGIQYLPSQFDLLVHREQGWFAQQHIEDQPFIGLGRIFGERRTVGEVHVHVADFHRAARDLGSEAQGDPFVGLNPDDQGVGAEFVGHGGVERQVWRAFEDQSDLGHPAAQPFSGTQVERHAGPPAGVDFQRDGGERLGGGVWRSRPRRQPTTFSPACQPAAYWPRLLAVERFRERVAESTLIFSDCNAFGLKLTGSSIAVRASSCIR